MTVLRTVKMFGGFLIEGAQQWVTPGTYTWTVPLGVRNVSAVGIGSGATFANRGGGGGALTYRNSIPVVYGQQISIVIPAIGSTTPTSFGTFLIANSANGQTGGAASTGTDIISFRGGNGGIYQGGYGGGGGAAGQYGNAGGDGSGYTYGERQVYQPPTENRRWEMTSDQYSHTVSQASANPRVTSGSTSTSQPAGSTYTYQAWIDQGGGVNGRTYAIHNQTYTLRVTTNPGYYYTVTDYYHTNPTGTAGLGRGGTAGQAGEGASIMGSGSTGTYGRGAGADVAAMPGALRIIYGKGRAFPNTLTS